MTNQDHTVASVSFIRKNKNYTISVIEQPNMYIRLDLVDARKNIVPESRFGTQFAKDFNSFNKDAESAREMLVQLIGLVCIDLHNQMTIYSFDQNQ